MACSFCRRRKLRCDESRPSCSSCVRVNRECEYHEGSRVRSQSKRSTREITYHPDPRDVYGSSPPGLFRSSSSVLDAVDAFALYRDSNSNLNNYRHDRHDSTGTDTTPDDSDAPITPFGYNGTDSTLYVVDPSSDPVSQPEFRDRTEIEPFVHSELKVNDGMEAELTELFFRDVYPGIPIIHKSRYYASLHLAPHSQPPLCLRNAMWALVAAQNSKWSYLANKFYEKARTYLEQDELRAAGTEVLNVAHVQCWCLISMYETYMLLSLRTWSSIRRAAALAHVLRLHSMDEEEEEAAEPPSHFLPDTHDPSELEERRRAFWSAFNNDRWISSSTGYPMTILETKITTKLPSSEDSFNSGIVEKTQSLGEALEVGFDANTSLYGARAVLACMMGRVMQHVGSASTFSITSGNQAFWNQHEKLDGLLLKVSGSRSDNLRPSSSTEDPKLWAFDMWLHGLSICLHQVAVDCALKQHDQDQVTRSLQRCREAADNIVGTIRSIKHIEAKKMDPFTASCVFMAATVLTRARSHGDSRVTDIEDLKLLESVLELMRRHWQVTEVFITRFKEEVANAGINLMITPDESAREIMSRKRLGYFNAAHRRCPSERTPGEASTSASTSIS